MAKFNFDAVMKEVFAHEGGYVNHRADPGGETNFGISKRSYPKEDIRGLTRARAKFIYQVDFWDPIKGDQLPDGVDLVTMDAAVNSGKSRGVRWTQTAVGLPKAQIDGIMGAKTLAAIQKRDPIELVKKACAVRVGFLRGLKTWGTFGKGWSRRVASVEATGVSMAAQAEGSRGYTKGILSREAKQAEVLQKRNSDTGHITAAGGATGTGGVETLHDLPLWAPLVVVGVAVLIAIFFYGRSRHDAQRATAYRNEMEKVL